MYSSGLVVAARRHRGLEHRIEAGRIRHGPGLARHRGDAEGIESGEVEWVRTRYHGLAGSAVLARLVGQPDVDGCERLGLGDLHQRFPGQLQHGDEGHDDDRHALADVEEVLELQEAAGLQAAQDAGYPDLCDRIATEEDAVEEEEVMAFLMEAGHPALTMDALF